MDHKWAHSRRELLALEDLETRFLIDPYVPESGVVLVYGKFGTYKTPLTMTMARSIADGTSMLGLDVSRASPVLYVEADSPQAAILGRFKAILKEGLDQGGEVDTCFCYPGFNVINQSDPRDRSWVLALTALHRDRKYRAVFIDSLRCLHSFDDRESHAPIQVYRALARMFPDSVIVLVHHDRKLGRDMPGGSSDESFAGSQAWANHATSAVQVKHANRANRELMLNHTKSQAGELAPAQLLKVKWGVDFGSAAKVDKDSYLAAAQAARARGEAVGDIDRGVAESLGISVRAAQRLRLKWAKDLGYENIEPGKLTNL